MIGIQTAPLNFPRMKDNPLGSSGNLVADRQKDDVFVLYQDERS